MCTPTIRDPQARTLPYGLQTPIPVIREVAGCNGKPGRYTLRNPARVMTEAHLLLLYALALGLGIVVSLIAALVIQSRSRRDGLSAFSRLETGEPTPGRLYVYVDNQSHGTALISEAGAVLSDGSRVPAPRSPEAWHTFNALPMTVGPNAVMLVCSFAVNSDVLTQLTGCYVIRGTRNVVMGRIHRR